MQRRNFVKKSVAAAIVAATPLALTGLVRAQGGATGATSTDTTDWWNTTDSTEGWDTTVSTHYTGDENFTEIFDPVSPHGCIVMDGATWVYVESENKCVKIAIVDTQNDPNFFNKPGNMNINEELECVIGHFNCDELDTDVGDVEDKPNCNFLKGLDESTELDNDMPPTPLSTIISKFCGYFTDLKYA